jgi:FkbM family methyltransferase
MIRGLLRPHYMYRPAQIIRRAAFQFERPRELRESRLPWGAVITYCPTETVGMAIARRGIYDYAVSEVLMRLADPGELALDVGANIGHMTSALAKTVGPDGKVVGFEPHPLVQRLFIHNMVRWVGEAADIEFRPFGLSNRKREALLATDRFQTNQGSGTVSDSPEPGSDVRKVSLRRLDELIDQAVGVMKVDVEGHELSVLKGSGAMLGDGLIRDIVFEEHREPPTPVTEFLQVHDYSIMGFEERLFGISAGPPNGVLTRDERSLLATLDPDRAERRLRLRGSAVYGWGPAAKH